MSRTPRAQTFNHPLALTVPQGLLRIISIRGTNPMSPYKDMAGGRARPYAGVRLDVHELPTSRGSVRSRQPHRAPNHHDVRRDHVDEEERLLDLVRTIFRAVRRAPEVVRFLGGDLSAHFHTSDDVDPIARSFEQDEYHPYSWAESEEELTTSFQDLLNGCPKQIRTEVYLDNQVLSFRALMDTGMDFNMIRQDIVLRNNLVVSEYHGPAVETIDTNRKFRPVGQVELQVGFPQGGRLRTYYEYFLVPPADVELNFDLAIGNPFINNAKILILNPQGFCLAHNKQIKEQKQKAAEREAGRKKMVDEQMQAEQNEFEEGLDEEDEEEEQVEASNETNAGSKDQRGGNQEGDNNSDPSYDSKSDQKAASK